jgi:hypothetical protein
MFERRDGLLPVFLDRPGARILVMLKPPGQEGELGRFLYQDHPRSGPAPSSPRRPMGRCCLDMSSFLVRDAFGVVDAIAAAKQGKFQLDAALSYVNMNATGVFPKNLEFEAHQTYTTTEEAGPEGLLDKERAGHAAVPPGMLIGEDD